MNYPYTVDFETEARGKVWPFAESPDELATRLNQALGDFDGDIVAALRNLFIEEPAGILTPQEAQRRLDVQRAAAIAESSAKPE